MTTSKSHISLVLSGLGEILTKGPWRVPAYQRSYSWEAEHVKQMCSDLTEAIERGDSEYFLGSIVIKMAKDDGAPEIVDGQQRLATSTIILAAMRDFFSDRKDQDRVESIEKNFLFDIDFATLNKKPKLTLNGTDHSFFEDTILERPGSPKRKRAPGKNRISEVNLQAAHKYARKFINEQAGDSHQLNRLFKFQAFLNIHANVIWVVVPDDANAYRIFEALNDRGLDLAISDLLKNHLFSVSDANLAQVQQHWIATTTVLESVADEIVVDFIRHYWSSVHGLTRDRQLYDSFQRLVRNKKEALEFAQRIQLEAGVYAAILSSSNSFWIGQTASAREYNDILNRQLGMVRMRPLILAILSTLSSKKETEMCLRYLVALSVRFLITGSGGSGAVEQAYADKGKAVRDKVITTAKDLALHLKPLAPSDEQFLAAFKIANVSKAKIARYYLNALERQEAGLLQPELVPNQNEDQLNLEHIIPQTPTADWKGMDPDVLRTYTSRLGNLALCQALVNSSAGNTSFTEKKKVLAASVLKLTKMISQEAVWGAKEVQSRQDHLATLAVKAWTLKVL